MEYTHVRHGNTLKAVIKYSTPESVTPRMFYSLFKKTTEGYIRIRTEAYPDEKIAFRVWRDEIAKAPLSVMIRKVKPSYHRAEGVTHFGRVNYNEFKDSPLREKRNRRDRKN